ncbi:uncharacterized protein SAPINGB_P004732 [Magnusiomyces paraingens]|uniref:Uncharacterized protein n=1 Tax=Magnusiomyces paraingens TaxID=2606893 RepID=A0A5E8C3N7_9ASCO|nr:uncharacterized protein SAPINGB_P004732 [Saprochaete ingens]VVT55775.1 unnamed protein product [Saprochaete ingens]
MLIYLESNFSVLNKFRFPRARVLVLIPSSIPPSFLSFKQALSCITNIHPKIDTVEYFEEFIRILPYFANLQKIEVDLNMVWKHADDKTSSALHKLECSHKVVQELKALPTVSRHQLHDCVAKILSTEDSQLVDIFTNLYDDPVGYLSEAMKYYNNNDKEQIFTMLCLQEAFFATLSKLDQLQALTYNIIEISIVACKSAKSPYSFLRQYPNLALQKIMGEYSNSLNLKYVILFYKASFETDVNLNSYDSGPIGKLIDDKAFSISDCFSFIPRPCTIYFNSVISFIDDLNVKFDFNLDKYFKGTRSELCNTYDESLFDIQITL